MGIPCCHNRYIEFFDEFNETLVGIAKPYAASCKNYGALGIFDFFKYHRCQAFVITRVLYNWYFNFVKSNQFFCFHDCRLNVQWNIEPNRTASPDFTEIPRFLQMISDTLFIRDHEKFSGSNIQKCLFVDSDLAGLLLKGNNVVHCDFTRSDLKGSRIDSSNVQNCIFTNADLSHIDFSKSQIKGCDFTAADLSDATIKYSSFVTNNVADAIWNRTASIGSNFTGMTFSGSLNDCSFENCEFSRVTFENATLTNCFFKGNNLKRVRFIDCKSDKLTLAFLKSGKADTTGITVVDSEGR